MQPFPEPVPRWFRVQATGRRTLRRQTASRASRPYSQQLPASHLPRVPEHWRTFQARRSPISGSPRLATNPVNAILNYLYAILEAEARLAAAVLGLDPGLGFLHADAAHRDSLAADLMEPVRPQVDAFVLDWILHEPIKREWFFEQRDGNCRLMAPFAARLSGTAQTWRRALAPLAESVARVLWSKIPKHAQHKPIATPLTQRNKREAKSAPSEPPPTRVLRRQNLCRGCGSNIGPGAIHCASCAVASTTERLKNAAHSGRVVAQSTKAQARRSAAQRRHAVQRKKWNTSELPTWLTEKAYMQRIQPVLVRVPNSTITSALAVSLPYAVAIRHGKRIPHPRHWVKLAELVGIRRSDE